jgi:hypothetical protein
LIRPEKGATFSGLIQPLPAMQLRQLDGAATAQAPMALALFAFTA